MAIVPVSPPKAYVSVCVKLEEARDMVIVGLLPILASVAVTVLVLGIVSSVTVAEQVVVFNELGGAAPAQEMVMLFVPSALWYTLVVADIATVLELYVITMCFDPLVVVPLIVMLPLQSPSVVKPVLVRE